MKRKNLYLFSIIVILLFGIFNSSCTVFNRELSFFRGKTVTIIVPNGKGGGIDTYARTLAPYLQKYLPGSTVEVINNTNNGGLEAKNDIFTANPDGLTIGFMPLSSTLLAEWAGVEGVNYHAGEFLIIGGLSSDDNIMVASPKSGLTSMQDFIENKKITMGFSSIVTDDYYVARGVSNLLGYDIGNYKIYTSSNDAGLACVKGDVDAIIFSYSSLSAQIEYKTVIPVVIFSDSRIGSLPDVPTIFEVVPEDKQGALNTLVQIYRLDRTLVAPPNLTDGRLNALRRAFEKAVSDPEYLAVMSELNRPVNFVDGETLAKEYQDIVVRKDEILSLLIGSDSQ